MSYMLLLNFSLNYHYIQKLFKINGNIYWQLILTSFDSSPHSSIFTLVNSLSLLLLLDILLWLLFFFDTLHIVFTIVLWLFIWVIWWFVFISACSVVVSLNNVVLIAHMPSIEVIQAEFYGDGGDSFEFRKSLLLFVIGDVPLFDLESTWDVDTSQFILIYIIGLFSYRNSFHDVDSICH